MTDAPTPEEDVTLTDLLERYAMLRDTILGLETEKEDLAARIKAALQGGERAETDLYRATLKVSRRLEYPVERFREAFGDALRSKSPPSTAAAPTLWRGPATSTASASKISPW
ncbi:hypothetical protein DR_2237 [Deinococcus radiodurans R1 = ATCC 13939 = DSM 20539]|uniref:Uncharacterized protein n=1 Tax=Deinococcus radiodurans (strain ATCC 13939 / DSM 20539 / JCM 16871 / CCUG 27074 / LMG 4051 / NBRC 15346 / NCIMB 9279 / VKM B-1422 / R1) TaxID=243230 RepID=Q9RS90_DEIRA|nr:hypothetical protein DR_2237 [Deinococcus radiodurans R1 = ATCC 13939 = DSM 20539]